MSSFWPQKIYGHRLMINWNFSALEMHLHVFKICNCLKIHVFTSKKLFAGFTKCGYRQRFIRGFTNPQIPIKIQVPWEAQISYAGPRCHESGLYTTWGGTNAVSPKISQQEQARGHLPQRGGWGLYQIEWLVMKCITEIVYVRVALPRKHHQLENNNSIINSLYRIRIMRKFVEYVLTVFELQWLHYKNAIYCHRKLWLMFPVIWTRRMPQGLPCPGIILHHHPQWKTDSQCSPNRGYWTTCTQLCLMC